MAKSRRGTAADCARAPGGIIIPAATTFGRVLGASEVLLHFDFTSRKTESSKNPTAKLPKQFTQKMSQRRIDRHSRELPVL